MADLGVRGKRAPLSPFFFHFNAVLSKNYARLWVSLPPGLAPRGNPGSASSCVCLSGTHGADWLLEL